MSWLSLFHSSKPAKARERPSTAPTPTSVKLNNVLLRLDHPSISMKLRERIAQGLYERQEAKCILQAGRQGDRLLEIGAGIGYISCLAALSGNFEAITVVEANPELIPIIEEHHKLNRVQAHLLNGAAVGEPVSVGEKVAFYLRKDFWASSMSAKPPGYTKCVDIPKICVQDLIRELKPTFFVCDIEGGEIDLIPSLSFEGVAKVMIELHQRVIGRRGMQTIFDAMSAKGFHYDQWHSCGSVVFFSRVER
jgi:FkbM family methyltransferase